MKHENCSTGRKKITIYMLVSVLNCVLNVTMVTFIRYCSTWKQVKRSNYLGHIPEKLPAALDFQATPLANKFPGHSHTWLTTLIQAIYWNTENIEFCRWSSNGFINFNVLFSFFFSDSFNWWADTLGFIWQRIKLASNQSQPWNIPTHRVNWSTTESKNNEICCN